jgi:competence protein ComEC
MQDRIPAQSFAAHPLAQLASVFALGILGAHYFVVPLSLLLSIAALTTLGAATTLLKKQIDRKSQLSDRQSPSVTTTFVMLAMLLLGWSLAAIEKNKIPANQLKRLLNEATITPGETIALGKPVELTGVLERDPEVAPERLYLFLRVQKLRFRETERDVSGEVLLLAPVSGKPMQREFDQLELRYGARIRVMTILERADTFRNPGVSSFTEYLDRKGYDATGFVKSPLLIERLENEPVFLPLAWLYEWRSKLQEEIDSRFSTDTAAVLDAALLGNRYKLSHATAERFREGGTFHVLVISGLHITFLGGLVFLIARRFTKSSALQFLLSVAVLWAYSLAVGAESSVVRAALMFSLVLLAPLVSRRASSLNALGGAALVLLTWHPADLLDPSFQLTFVSVLAIVIFAWPLLEKMAAVGSWRPTRQTPYPPACAPWLRNFCESLFWSECKAELELERVHYSYKLFKIPLALTLERLHLQRLLRYAFGAITVSACVQMALLPFLVVYFHRLSFASLVLNIGVSLMMAGVAVIAAFALLIAQFSNDVAAPLVSVANGLNWTMVHSVDPFAKVGAASIRLPEYTAWAATVYVLYYVPLTMLAVSLSRWMPLNLPGSGTQGGLLQTLHRFADSLRSLRLKKTQELETAKPAKNPQRSAKISLVPRRIVRLAMLAQLLTIALVVFHPFSAGRPQGKLRLDFLDVGQGDSALVTFPDNTTLLVDGGGRPGPFQKDSLSGDVGEEVNATVERETQSIGESVVSEYLWWRGLDHIDYILATHADADHIDGLNDVAQNFSVWAALVARTPNQDPEYARFSETLSAKGIPVRIVGAGDVLRFGEVTASVLWPSSSVNPNAASRNNDSLVLRLQLRDVVFLLTGDIEMSGESAMLQAHQSVRADVVKVAHHGSKTSSTGPFVAAVQPRFAVVSVGQTSIFGHPNKEVVERWKTGGAHVLTTGESGTITITTDGRNLNLETFVKER